MSTAVQAPIIIDDEGVAYIEGTTTKVVEVVLNKEWTGATPEELQTDMPHLSLAQIHAALFYYYQHEAEFERQIAADLRLADEIKARSGESPFVRRMRAEGKLP
jgi:uncharacterized protein (DUF433 family)